jgi:hypothetical protein
VLPHMGNFIDIDYTRLTGDDFSRFGVNFDVA